MRLVPKVRGGQQDQVPKLIVRVRFPSPAPRFTWSAARPPLPAATFRRAGASRGPPAPEGGGALARRWGRRYLVGPAETNAAMTIDLPLSGIAHGRSGGELTVMRDAAGGPAFGRLGAPRGRSAVAGREGEPVAPGPGCAGRPGGVVPEPGFPPLPPPRCSPP